MSKVVFVLGAGCSKMCGAPLMADFLDVASSLHSTGKVASQATHFGKVFKAIGALQSVHSKSQLDLNNIESVFNAFETANTVRKLPGFQADEIAGVIDSLKQVIVSTIEETIKFPFRGSHISAAPHPYEAFAALLEHIRTDAFPPASVSVITFNYDIAVDMALFRARMGPDYALDPTESKGVPLLKLHGSLNWASKMDSSSVIPLTLDKYFGKYSINTFTDSGSCSIPIGSQIQEYFSKFTDIAVRNEPVIVPPTWNKVEHYQALSSVWSGAAKELGEAEYVFIIGYSLPDTDAFFRLLYALGTVGDTPFKKIEVFNPDPSGVVHSRFESLMGPAARARFKYIIADFSQSIGIIQSYFPKRS